MCHYDFFFLIITMAMQLYFSDMFGINDMQWGCGADIFFFKNKTKNFSNIKKKNHICSFFSLNRGMQRDKALYLT